MSESILSDKNTLILLPIRVMIDKSNGNRGLPEFPVLLLIKFQEILIISPSKKVMMKIVTHHAIPAMSAPAPLIPISLSSIFCGQMFMSYMCSKYK